MQCIGLGILVLLSTAAAVDVHAASGSPVERVVTLLTDLKSKLVADGEAEQKIYDKYACFCDTTSSRKANAIVDAKNDLRALGQSILKLKGEVATLTAEIDELKADIKANQEAQDSATAVRQKENAGWTAESFETKQALAALQQAVKVLGDATGKTTLLQSSEASRARAALGVRSLLEKLPTSDSLAVKPEHLSLLGEFAANSAKYAPQSASIQGILTDMYTTFSSNLEYGTRMEASQNRLFEDFMATKQQQMIDMQKTKQKKEEEKAGAEADLAQTTQNYDDTEAQMNADIKFFDITKDACMKKSEEWTLRSKMRAEEVEGVTKALEILTSDDAREMFSKAIKPGKETNFDFLQVASVDSASAPVAKAFAALKKAATQSHSLRLASLAATVRYAKAGHFDEVIAAIDEVIQTLKDEAQSDIEKRNQCKDEYQNVASKSGDLNWLIQKNEAKIDKLSKLIEQRNAEKAKTVEEIADVAKQIETMEDERKAENEAFLNAKAEDKAAIELLTKAKDFLSSFYKKNADMGEIQGSAKGAALNQEPVFEVSENQAPDATFSDKGNRKTQSKGIVSILTMLIEDLEDEIKGGKKSEAGSQVDFEAALNAAQELKESLIKKKENLEDTIAKRKVEKIEENEDMEDNSKDLKDEVDYKAEIKPDCDWILGAFTDRATKRAQEVEGLTSAKASLAGMAGASSAALLDNSDSFDDEVLSHTGFLGLK